MNKVLAIGGPAEGKMMEDLGPYLKYIEPVTQMWSNADYLDPVSRYNLVQHYYIKRTLGFENYRKDVYVHNSLDMDAGMVRLREFLVVTFIKGVF